MWHRFSKEHLPSCSKPFIHTAPTVSEFLWCKMKEQLILHQFLHRLSEKIRQDLRRYEKCENRETVALQRFEKI